MNTNNSASLCSRADAPSYITFIEYKQLCLLFLLRSHTACNEEPAAVNLHALNLN